MIRQATIEDLPRMEDRAKEFYAASRVMGEFDIESFVQAWTALFGMGGVIFVSEREGQLVGAIGGLIHPEIYGPAGKRRLIAEEFFWFVGSEYRRDGVALYRRFEEWAWASGAAEVQMVHLVDSMPEKLERFYESQGYGIVEKRYAKRK